jgi:hypothetical protein
MNTISEFMDYLGIDVITNQELIDRLLQAVINGDINNNEYGYLLDQIDNL